jgi:hypothetical protein
MTQGRSGSSHGRCSFSSIEVACRRAAGDNAWAAVSEALNKLRLMNWDMLVPTLVYLVLIAVGLVTYTIVGLGHH